MQCHLIANPAKSSSISLVSIFSCALAFKSMGGLPIVAVFLHFVHFPVGLQVMKGYFSINNL